MRKLPTFEFEGYTLRPVEERDMEMARAWTSADPWHQHLAPGFWMDKSSLGIDCYVVESEGEIVFFFRVETAARMLMQFNPEDKPEIRLANMDALRTGMSWLAVAMGAIGVQEGIFDTRNPALKNFACKRLGFEATPDLLSKKLPQPARKETL